MLTSLILKNFKSWKKLDVPFARITGIFGTNSSGKSSLIQFLLLLKHTKDAPDRRVVFDFGDFGQLVNLGSYKDIVFHHDVTRNISWSLEWKIEQPLTILNPEGSKKASLFKNDLIKQDAEVSFVNKAPVTKRIAYDFDGETFSLEENKSKVYDLFPSKTKKSNKFYFIREQGRVWNLPGPQKTYLFPDQAKTYYQNASFLGQFEAEYERLIDNIFYLGPLREYPKREYRWAGGRPTDVGIRGDKVIDAILAATDAGEKRKVKVGKKARYYPFQEVLAYWLKEMGLIDSFKVNLIADGANLYKAEIKIGPKTPEALITDVGFGISQVLPAVVLLQYVPEGSTVVLEQPEIHLHPKVQSGLADMMITTALIRNLQIIVESHSEHFLRRLQRRMAEGTLKTSDVKLYFCDIKDEGSHLDTLKMDLYGNIENWPKGFFGDEFEEIAAIQEATLKRKIQASK